MCVFFLKINTLNVGNLTLPLGLVEPLGCLPASPQEASCHLVPLGNFQEVISSKFPLQSQIPHTARINTLSSLWALLFGSGNLISFCQLDHMLQIPFDVVEDLLDSVGLIAVWPAAWRDFQHIIRTICCEKLMIWDLRG